MILSRGRLMQLIRVDGIPISVAVDGVLYPVIADHLGSIRAMLSPDASAMLWERHYGAWGDKRVYLSGDSPLADSLEKATIWSYAGLVELSGDRSENHGKEQIYLSRSRAYAPGLREWLSVDELVKWDPKTLIGKPGNWRGVRYAGGRPLEMVDPSGRWATEAHHALILMAFGDLPAAALNQMMAGSNSVDGLGYSTNLNATIFQG
jgi:RHS repeat-associated protein